MHSSVDRCQARIRCRAVYRKRFWERAHEPQVVLGRDNDSVASLRLSDGLLDLRFLHGQQRRSGRKLPLDYLATSLFDQLLGLSAYCDRARAAVYDPSLATLHEKRGSLPPYWQLTIPPELTLYAMILAEMAIFTHYEITCFNNPNWKCRGLFWERLCPIRGIYWLAISTFKRRFPSRRTKSVSIKGS